MEIQIKAQVEKGVIPSEKFTYIEDEEGHTIEIIMPKSQVKGDSIVAFEIQREPNRVLVEFTRESCCGSWRAWIKPDQIV